MTCNKTIKTQVVQIPAPSDEYVLRLNHKNTALLVIPHGPMCSKDKNTDCFSNSTIYKF